MILFIIISIVIIDVNKYNKLLIKIKKKFIFNQKHVLRCNGREKLADYIIKIINEC